MKNTSDQILLKIFLGPLNLFFDYWNLKKIISK